MAPRSIIADAFNKENFIVFTWICKYDPQIQNHLEQSVEHQSPYTAFGADKYEKSKLVAVCVWYMTTKK